MRGGDYIAPCMLRSFRVRPLKAISEIWIFLSLGQGFEVRVYKTVQVIAKERRNVCTYTLVMYVYFRALHASLDKPSPRLKR